MTLEGSAAKYCIYLQNRKPAAPHTFMSALFHKGKMIQISRDYFIFHQRLYSDK